MLVLMLGLGLVFQARPADLGWVLFGGALAYAGLQIGNHFGYWQGLYIGALLLGIDPSAIPAPDTMRYGMAGNWTPESSGRPGMSMS